MLKLRLIWIFAALTAPAAAQAFDVCEAYRNTTPLPSWFPAVCNPQSGGGILAHVGGAFSTFADSFNLNPASIPTSLTPYGVEYIGSLDTSTSQIHNNFALIKGYKRFGAGLSTNSDDTFYSNSQTQNFLGSSASSSLQSFVPDSIAPTLNLSSALALLPEKLQANLSSNLGVAVKYNKYSQKFAPGLGVSLEAQRFSFGLSAVRETETQYAPAVTYYTMTVGVKTPYFQLEYVYLQNATDNSLVNDPMQILTGSISHKGLLGTLALRLATDPYGSHVIQGHLAIQYLFTRYFAAGYLLNYIPGTQSLGVQVFL